MRRVVLAALTTLSLIGMGEISVHAAVPRQINFQGLLRSGSPAANVNGTVNMSFKICDDSVCTTTLWEEPVAPGTIPVTVVDGVYRVVLGGNGVPIPSSVFADPTVYLEVTVDTQVLLPRQQLLATPYTAHAAEADSALLANNALSATALASNGANCPVGSSPLGIDPAGNVEACFDVATQTEIDAHTADLTAHGATSANFSSRIVRRDGNGDFMAGTITATAFAGDGSQLTGLATERPLHSITALDVGGAGQHSSIAIGVDGLAVISYFDATNHDLMVAHCDNVGCTSATITTLLSTGSVGEFTSIAIGMDGFPVISYLDVDTGIIKVAHCTTKTCLGPVDHFEIDAGEGQSSITIGMDGFPIISYQSGSEIRVAHCQNVECSLSSNSRLDNTVAVTGDTSIAIGLDGFPIVSYFDDSNDALRIAKCINFDCTADPKPITAYDSSGAGPHNSITIGRDGLPIVSYFNALFGQLRVVHCDDVPCSSATTTVLDSGGVGTHTSITVGEDGLPVISYFDATNGDLKVAHCTMQDCLGPVGQMELVGGTLVEDTSITIGIDGFPIISAYDAGTGSLQIMHCSNRGCIPWHRKR